MPQQTNASAETVLTGAKLVLPDRLVEGSLCLRGAAIAEVSDDGSSHPGAVDLDGGYLLPGLVELHTDNVEKHLVPRPGVVWPSGLSAIIAHDTQVVGAGITTVFDALALGEYRADGARRTILAKAVASLEEAVDHGVLRADHFLHLRCEIVDPALPGLIDDVGSSPLVRLMSVMDHTPGQRQMSDMETIRSWLGKHGYDDATVEAEIRRLKAVQDELAGPQRRLVIDTAKARGIPVASHDDETVEHVDQALAEGIALAEFPTTEAAARHAHLSGMKVIMGAPNLVRGGSHSGNISAEAVAAGGWLDILSSDYAPKSLLHAAFLLWESGSLTLPQAIGAITATPALTVGLTDRGALAAGLRADLVWAQLIAGVPVVRGVWRAGQRVL